MALISERSVSEDSTELVKTRGIGVGPVKAFQKPKVHRSNPSHNAQLCPSVPRLSACAEGHPGELGKINTLKVI